MPGHKVFRNPRFKRIRMRHGFELNLYSSNLEFGAQFGHGTWLKMDFISSDYEPHGLT